MEMHTLSYRRLPEVTRDFNHVGVPAAIFTSSAVVFWTPALLSVSYTVFGLVAGRSGLFDRRYVV